MEINALLKTATLEPTRVIPFDINTATRLDLSKDNKQLQQTDLNNPDEFSGFINDQITRTGATVGWGGYREERGLYSRSELFDEEEPRTIHLGIDIWMAAGTEVRAPLAAEVHSYANREVHGDYGPVIILKHSVAGTVFHTLYGHLSTASLAGLEVGQRIEQGQSFASLGKYEENFHWPPHLHFQVIMDMQGNEGDYPGVCKASESAYYFANCPDPAALVFG
ncbi:MAG: hypothetical protein Roseis2KO_48530 [Roseivirga sp.]